jgi:hypothetical protein
LLVHISLIDISDLIVILLVHLLELDLLMNVMLTTKLDHAWLGAEHHKDEQYGNVNECLVHTELLFQSVAE